MALLRLTTTAGCVAYVDRKRDQWKAAVGPTGRCVCVGGGGGGGRGRESAS